VLSYLFREENNLKIRFLKRKKIRKLKTFFKMSAFVSKIKIFFP